MEACQVIIKLFQTPSLPTPFPLSYPALMHSSSPSLVIIHLIGFHVSHVLIPRASSS